jgi:hypothetical protein
MKCKHDNGWCINKNINIFVFPNNEIGIDWNFGNKSAKLKARCNNPDCNAERNVYIKGAFIQYGNILYRKVKRDTNGYAI